MKKFLLGLLAGFVLAGMALVITFFAAVRLGDRRPSLPDDGVLVLRLEGSIPERAPMDIPLPAFQAQAPQTMIELWNVLRRVETDKRIKAVILEPQGVDAGWAQLQEIRDGLLRVKRAGKPIYAFLRYPTAREYYLATAATSIHATSEDLLYVKGLRAELQFYKRTLDKIGVKMEVETAGKYKDAADSYSRDSMTPETRDVMNAVLDDLYAHLVGAIAEGRKLTPEQVRAFIDEGPFLATDAHKKGLLDELLFEDEFYDKVKKDLKITELRKISHREYQRSLEGRRSGPKVAFVVGEGPILRGRSTDSWGQVDEIRSEPFIKLLRDIGNDEEVRGVVLRVNSPGGDAIASDEILREVRNLSKKKPMIVSMSDVAASGGYYIAMTGDPVLAYPNTFTGSIGVVFSKPDLGGLYDKLGISVETLTRGRNADIDALHKPMSAAARSKLREGIAQTYRTFLDRVADGRKKKVEEIEPLAQGRVWLGSQAKRNGLIDEVGGLDRALEMLREKAKIGKDERLRIIPYPRRKSILEQLLGATTEDFERMAARWRMRGILESAGLDLPHPELWTSGAILRLAPYTLRIH